MRTIIAVALLSVLILPLTALAEETQESFQAAYDAAEAARQKAAEADSEWRDTQDILEQSKAAAEAGNFDEAVKLANTAKFQGERGAEQGELQAKIWRDAVPKM